MESPRREYVSRSGIRRVREMIRAQEKAEKMSNDELAAEAERIAGSRDAWECAVLCELAERMRRK